MEKRHVVMNPAYGYINEEDKYVGFDLQRAALFSDEDINQLFTSPSVERDEISVLSFTEEQLENDVPFDLEASPTDENARDAPSSIPLSSEKFALLNPSYGYLNKDTEYKSFDLEDAAIYTQEDLDRLDLNGDEFIRQPFTDKQLADVPFKEGIPNVLEAPFAYTVEPSEVSDTTTPEFDAAAFGRGLDDLDLDIVDERTQ